MHQLLIAGVRCVAQLSLLGYILVPIFQYNQAWMVAAYATFMLLVSAAEAIARPTFGFKVCVGGEGEMVKGRDRWGCVRLGATVS